MVKCSSWTVGIDFDNTIVSYDSLLYTIAHEQNLIGATANPGKKAIRDMIRGLPDGDNRWQELQAAVYGPYIERAILIDGVWAFMKRCLGEECHVYVISHKTEYANKGNPRANLRQAALRWMEQNRFFDPNGLGLSRSQVVFAETREEKIAQICDLGCTHFIDDLEEVFLESDFPKGAEKILYSPQSAVNQLPQLPGMKVFRTWQQITDYLFMTP